VDGGEALANDSVHWMVVVSVAAAVLLQSFWHGHLSSKEVVAQPNINPDDGSELKPNVKNPPEIK